MTPAYMTILQFMVELFTGVTNGKKEKIYIGIRKMREAILIGRPNFPRDQRCRGKGSPRRRLMTTQPIEMMYEDIREVSAREMMA